MGVKQIVFNGSSGPGSNNGGGLMAFDYVMIGILLILIGISVYYIVTTPKTVSKKENFSTNSKKTIVYLFMNGCPYCVKFDKTFEEAKGDKSLSSEYKFEKYDMSSDEGKRWNEKTKCNGFPCYAVVDASTKDIIKRETGHKSLSDFKNWL